MTDPVEIRPLKDGTIDEIVASDVTVHVEQMDKNCYWMAVEKGGKRWAFWFRASGRIKLTGGLNE